MAGYLIGGRFLTGEVTQRRIIPKSCTVELTLNAAEATQATLLPSTDPATGIPVDLPNVLVPGRDFLGWVEDGVLVSAGQVQADPFSFPSTDTVTAGGMLDYFERRYVLPQLLGPQMPDEVESTWTGLSLRTIAKRIVQQARSWPFANVPVDFEADVTGDEERTYRGVDLVKVSEALANLTDVADGPDITFRPKLVDNGRYVRWDLLTGTPELRQGGADHYWDIAAPSPYATVTDLARDGRDLATDVYGLGAASGASPLMAKGRNTALTTFGFPMMETTEQFNSVSDPDELQAHVNAATLKYSAHTETFTLRVRRNQTPKLGTYWPGDYARLNIGENHRVPAGQYRVRIVRVSFAEAGDVTVECAPERVAGGYPIPASNRRWLREQLRFLNARINDINRGA